MHLSRALGGAIAVLTAVVALFAAEPLSDPNTRAALDRISAASMRGHVSFLASDLLEGRATPSRGLDIAAEYIAAQFRRAGLEPAIADGYFQPAPFVTLEPEKNGASFDVAAGDQKLSASADQMTVQAVTAVSLFNAPVLKISLDPSTVERLKPADVAGRVVAAYVARVFGPEAENRYEAITALRKLKPGLILLAGPAAPRQQRRRLLAADQLSEQVPTVGVRDGEIAKALESANAGPLDWKIDAKLPAAKQMPITLRNVAAVLHGSDAVLKDTYILVTAHYDHVGIKQEGDGDRIYNGANDDASGVASLVEVANAMAAMNPRPKRSVLFVALFGEEEGLLGSAFYGRHPIVPLRSTIADINLEQLGRTDSIDGAKVASASFTGFDFSAVPAIFKQAGEQVGVSVYKDEKRSDPFFARSDNQALADIGIPAHTLCVAFEYPDYHAVGDEWQKLDYDNMAKIDRMVALGVISMANSDTAPPWNESEAKARKYAAAWHALHEEHAQ